MYDVKPTAGELYYLRLLLLHVTAADMLRGARRGDALALAGAGYAAAAAASATPFRDAAGRLGLLQDDAETVAMLCDAVGVDPPPGALRNLLAEALMWSLVVFPDDVERSWGPPFCNFAAGLSGQACRGNFRHRGCCATRVQIVVCTLRSRMPGGRRQRAGYA